MKIKICTKCKKKYPATLKYFYYHFETKDRLRPECKICHKQISKEYKQSEKGKITQQKYHNTIKGYLRCIYANMNYRCKNSTAHNYNRYGGRGIQNKFKSLNDFRSYVINILKIDPRGLQIDRINNDGHYKKGNIRFVTAKKNCNNR